MEQLTQKTLVMLVGPTAIGKSTLMNATARLDSEFARVTGFTTREPRQNDEPGQYRYYTQAELQEKIDTDSLVQYAVFPTTGQAYGTELIDYPGVFNLKDTLSNAVEDFKKVPFAQVITISVVANPDDWKQWLQIRYPTASNERKQRLEQAVISLEWSLSQIKDHYWIINRAGDTTSIASELIELVRNPIPTSITPKEADELYQTAKTLLSYE